MEEEKEGEEKKQNARAEKESAPEGIYVESVKMQAEDGEEVKVPIKESQDYVKDHQSLIQKIQGNVRAMNQFRKIYNSLCSDCKKKVIQNPRMDISEYCEPCRNKVNYRMGRIKEILK